VVVCSSDGVWTFATPQDQSPPPSPPAPTRAVVKKTTSVPASTSIGATAAASSAPTMGTTDTPPRVACAPVTPLLSCANDAGVEVCGGLLVEGDEMPPPTILAIVPDDESAYRNGADIIGLDVEGRQSRGSGPARGARGGGGRAGPSGGDSVAPADDTSREGTDVGCGADSDGSDGDDADDVGAPSSLTDGDDSDSGLHDSDEGKDSERFTNNEDE